MKGFKEFITAQSSTIGRQTKQRTDRLGAFAASGDKQADRQIERQEARDRLRIKRLLDIQYTYCYNGSSIVDIFINGSMREFNVTFAQLSAT